MKVSAEDLITASHLAFVGRVTASLSHEVKNTLAIISESSGLMGDLLETLRRIKETYPHIQVIMLTGHASTKEGIEGMRLGAFDYLMKPVDIEELIAKMKACIKAIAKE